MKIIILLVLFAGINPLFSAVINEIMYNPEISALFEFVELYNPGASPVDLSQFYFSSGIDFKFPAGSTLPAHGFVVLVKDPTQNIGVPPGVEIFGPYDGKLSNSGEKLTLKNSVGQTLESLTYGESFPWPTGADGYGASLERISPELPASDFHTWRASLVKNGTPGRPNSVAQIPDRPLIRSCKFYPEHPHSTQPVSVTVELDSPEQIQSVTLQSEILQRGMRLGAPAQLMELAETTATASRWTAELPPASSQSLVRVNFQIQRSDGQEVILPHAGERRPFFSYFVYDQEIETRLPMIWLFPHVKSGLVALDSNYIGAVILEGTLPQVFDAVDRQRSENGYKIKFIKGEEFQGNRTLNLIPELSYETGGTSGAPAPFFEHLGFRFFRRMGVLAPEATWFRVVDYHPVAANLPKPDGEMTQQILIQQPNENFLELNGRNSAGNIYKLLWDRPLPEKKTNLDEGSEDLTEILNLNSIRDSTARYQELARLFFLDDVIAYEAASVLTSNWDGFHNNMFWYHDLEGSGKWEIIPWDLDKIWGFTDSNPQFTRLPLDYPLRGRSTGVSRPTGPIAPAIHRDTGLDRQYRARVAFELDHLFSMDTLFHWIAQDETQLLQDLELIERESQQMRPKRRAQIIAGYGHIREFIKLRHQYLRGELRLPVSPQYLNQPPRILKITPANTTILTFGSDSTRFFEITASDPGDILHFTWLLNGDTLAGAETNSLRLHERDCRDRLNHLTVFVADSLEFVPVVWQIRAEPRQNVAATGDRLFSNQLLPNFPNPFNAHTTIAFEVAQAGLVRLEIFNVLGQQVQLLANTKFSAGEHVLPVNLAGQASGIYWVRLQAGIFQQTRKMLLLR